MPPFPVPRLLVDESIRPAVKPELTIIDEPIAGGLPHRIELEAGLELVLVVPNGLAVTWRDADPTSVVTESGPELAPHADAPRPPRPPVRMILQRGVETLASLALTANGSRTAADDSAVVEVVVLGWDVRAGSLRSPGDFGSRIRLAWRRADSAAATFQPPPVPAAVAARLSEESRLESQSEAEGR